MATLGRNYLWNKIRLIMRKIIFISTILIFFSCKKEKWFDGPNTYSDGFENYSNYEEMLMEDNSLWSFTQLTKSGNVITIDTNIVHTGNKSLKFTAEKSDDVVSKCSISKQKMAFFEKETVQVKIWYYLVGTNTCEWLFLMDLEEQAAIGAGPGVRLALVDDKIRMEYKFFENDVVQTEGSEIDFPRNQWVEIIWEVKLSQKEKGAVKVYQNGQLIINKEKIATLPKDILYFQQGTKGMYQSIEIGLTANTKDNSMVLYADDFEIKKLD